MCAVCSVWFRRSNHPIRSVIMPGKYNGRQWHGFLEHAANQQNKKKKQKYVYEWNRKGIKIFFSTQKEKKVDYRLASDIYVFFFRLWYLSRIFYLFLIDGPFRTIVLCFRHSIMCVELVEMVNWAWPFIKPKNTRAESCLRMHWWKRTHWTHTAHSCLIDGNSLI